MGIFALSVTTFTVLLLIAGVLYVFVDKTLLKPRSKMQILRRTLVRGSHVWWLTTVLYAGFCTLVFFMLSTAFAVEMHIDNMSSAMHYIVVIFPASLVAALAFYFTCRWLIERFML